MTTDQPKPRIPWYRTPLDRDTLAALNQRSDWRGLLQTGGYLGLLAVTAAAAWVAAGRQLWPAVLLALFLHGTFVAFLLNGFHELCHSSVFKTKFLNTFFLYLFSFLGWTNPILFWTSHVEHHKYTLHPPHDLEVVQPVKLTLDAFLKSAAVNPWGFYARLKSTIRLSLGKLEGEWENALFPESAVEKRRRLFNWARVLLVGHALIIHLSQEHGITGARLTQIPDPCAANLVHIAFDQGTGIEIIIGHNVVPRCSMMIALSEGPGASDNALRTSSSVTPGMIFRRSASLSG